MTGPATYHARVQALSETLQARLGVRGRTLEKRLRRAGRRLPPKARRAGREIVEAGRHIDHPKLARFTDAARLEEAFATLEGHLKKVNRKEERLNAFLGTAGALVFNLLLLGAGVLLFLWWSGLL
ncbi:MAG: hypothetical protein RIG84_06825 [Roseovarius sp.]